MAGDRPESVNFDRIAHRYDATRGGMERGRDYASELEPLFTRAGAVLEPGIGTGLVAAALGERGRTVFGLDISSEMLSSARTRLGARVARADAARMPLTDDCVGDAYSAHFLHLVSDVRAVLAEVRRAVRAGGRYLHVNTRYVADDDDAAWHINAEMRRLLRDDQSPYASDLERLADDVVGARRLFDHAGAAGIEFEGVVEGLPHGIESESPRQLADRIETRTSSALWDVPDDRWNDVVVPALAALRALPDGDRPRSRQVVVITIVFRVQ